VPLGIVIEQQDPLIAFGKRSGEVGGNRRLPAAALLVG
jgi:hypothetical protein